MTKIDFNHYINYLVNKRKQMNCTKNVSNQYQSHACAILDKKNGHILGISHNKHYSQNKTHYGTIHAEDAMIKKFGSDKRFQNKKLYLLVIRTNGGNSKPCSDCISKLNNCNLKFSKIFYTNVVNGIKGVSFDNINQLVNDPDIHTTSYYKNKTNSCACIYCSNHNHNCSDDEDIDDDEDDDEAKRNLLNTRV